MSRNGAGVSCAARYTVPAVQRIWVVLCVPSRGAELRNLIDAANTVCERGIKPELILISAGFDSHREDPVGSLGLEAEDFARLTQAVLDVADSYADGKLVSVLEGGYNPDALAKCVQVHLQEMLSRTPGSSDECE